MPRYFLSGLKVEGFRGINNEGDPLNLTFAPDKVNSVFAVNGNGKSSLFEALCYAIKGRVPKLDEAATDRKENYYSNRFHSAGQATIDIALLPDDGSGEVTIRVARDPRGQRSVSSPSGHANPEGLLAELNEDFTLLDYKTFSRFIDDTPLNRGRSFSSLLGLSTYSDMRQSLQAACDTKSLNNDFEIKVLAAQLKAASDAARNALTAIRNSYTQLTGQTITDVSDLEGASQRVVDALATVELLMRFLAGKKLDELDFQAIKDRIRAEEGGEKQRELEKATEDLAKAEGLGAAISDTVKAESASLAALLTQRDELLAKTQGESIKNLLEAASSIVNGEDWTDDRTCPLCESKLETSIREHVAEHLRQYEGLASKLVEIKDAWRASSLVKRLYKLEAFFAVEDAKQVSRSVTANADAGNLNQEALDRACGRLEELEKELTTKIEAVRTQKEALAKSLPPSLVKLTEQVEHARQFHEQLKIFIAKQAEESDATSRLQVRERWRTFISKAQEIFAEAEGRLAKDKIAAIEPEYKKMFRDIMYVNDVVPELRRDDGSEDLFVQLSDFHGQKSKSARALLSESYVNALAISVYLAAALKNSCVPRFLVLDDVTSSFDAGHQLALMDVIREQLQQPRHPDGIQFIILSHDGLLEKYFDRLGNEGNWKHHKLQGSPPMGAILGQAQDGNRLRTSIMTLLDAGQTSQAEPLIRQYLEFKLMQIIRKSSIPVPLDFAMKDNNRMVANCVEAITDAVKLHKNAGSIVLDAAQIQNLDSRHVPAILGNWCSHYETASMSSLSAPMLKSVIQSIDDLADCFTWEDTSQTPPLRKWYRSLSAR